MTINGVTNKVSAAMKHFTNIAVNPARNRKQGERVRYTFTALCDLRSRLLFTAINEIFYLLEEFSRISRDTKMNLTNKS